MLDYCLLRAPYFFFCSLVAHHTLHCLALFFFLSFLHSRVHAAAFVCQTASMHILLFFPFSFPSYIRSFRHAMCCWCRRCRHCLRYLSNWLLSWQIVHVNRSPNVFMCLFYIFLFAHFIMIIIFGSIEQRVADLARWWRMIDRRIMYGNVDIMAVSLTFIWRWCGFGA